MKICPQCAKVFPVDMNYCLDDGVTLMNYPTSDPAKTVSYTKDPPKPLLNQVPARQNRKPVTEQSTSFGQSFQKLDRPNIFFVLLGAFGIIGVIVAVGFGGFLYLKSKMETKEWYPTPTPNSRVSPK